MVGKHVYTYKGNIVGIVKKEIIENSQAVGWIIEIPASKDVTDAKEEIIIKSTDVFAVGDVFIMNPDWNTPLF